MVAALLVLLVLSAFFSIAETAMMAINRYRLQHLVAQGHGGALRVTELLKRTDRLLGGILIGNTLVIAAASTLSSLVAVRLLGEDKLAYAIGTLVISFLIIVFSEITPKVIGATYPERTALLLSYPAEGEPARARSGVVVRQPVRAAAALAAAHRDAAGRRRRRSSRPRRSARWCSSRRSSCRRSTARSCSTCSTSAR